MNDGDFSGPYRYPRPRNDGEHYWWRSSRGFWEDLLPHWPDAAKWDPRQADPHAAPEVMYLCSPWPGLDTRTMLKTAYYTARDYAGSPEHGGDRYPRGSRGIRLWGLGLGLYLLLRMAPEEREGRVALAMLEQQARDAGLLPPESWSRLPAPSDSQANS